MRTRKEHLPSTLWPIALVLFFATAVHAQQMTMRDSAGTRIVTIRGLDTLKRAPELSTTLIAQIGGGTRGPQYEFTTYFDGLFLRNGEIALPAGSEIRFFDAKGTWIRSLGRRGEGPGEFAFISGMCALQDGSLLAYDSRRYTLFDKSGAVSWTANSTGALRACLSDNSLLISNTTTARTLPPLRSDLALTLAADTALRYTRYSRLTMEAAPRFLEDVALVRNRIIGPTTSRVSTSGARVLVVASRPFYHTPTVAAAPGRACVAEGLVFEVRCYDIKGGSTFILRVDRPPRRVTEDRKRAYVANAVSFLSDGERESRIREIERTGFPETLPPYSRILCDDAGRIWIQDYVQPDATAQQWNVFRSTGEHVGTVGFPSDLVLIDVTRNRVMARYRDADGFVVAKIFSLGQ